MASSDRDSSTLSALEPRVTIREMISEMASAFRAVDFARLEEELVSREQELRRALVSKGEELRLELAEKAKRIELLETFRLEKIATESEVRELKEKVSKLRQERDEFERKYMEGIKKEVELKERIGKLEVEKLEAISAADVLSTRFKDVVARVSGLERDWNMLTLGSSGIVKCELPEGEEENVDGGRGSGGGDSCNVVPENGNVCTAGGDGVDLGRGVAESGNGDAGDAGEMRTGNSESGMDVGKPSKGVVKVEVDVIDCDGIGSGKSNGCDSVVGKGGLLEQGGIRLGSTGSGMDVGKTSKGVVKIEGDIIDCDGIANAKANGDDSMIGKGVVPGKDCKKPLPGPVVELIDSDDDATPCQMRSAEEMKTSLRAHSFPSSATKGTFCSRRVSITHAEDADGVIGSRMLKRKQASEASVGGSNNCHNNNNDQVGDCETPASRYKLMKVDQRSETSSRNASRRTTFSPSRQDDELSSDDTSSSSSSEPFIRVPFASNFLMDEKTSEVRKKWECQIDMVAALETDRTLCLKAVCVLHRQAWVGSSSAVSSQNRSFDKLDLCRIKTLADFLIDGDRHWKPRKSVEELSNHDPKGLDDCKRLAIKYSSQLFETYGKQGDALFSS